jgi:short-subunit dehydrogenase
MTVPTMISLKEKTALITGASSGVGRALAFELAALGAAVLLLSRTPQKLELVAQEIRRRGSAEVQTFPIDLTDEAVLHRFSGEFRAKHSGLDFLIHSAGIFRHGAVASAPLAEFDELYRVNVRAPLALTQLLLPQLMAAKGTVVFINSTAGVSTHANVGQYAASKHALKAVADTLRLENSAQGLRVMSVMLGRTATPMQQEVCRLEGSAYDASKFLQPQDVARTIAHALILPDSAELTDLYIRPTRR